MGRPIDMSTDETEPEPEWGKPEWPITYKPPYGDVQAIISQGRSPNDQSPNYPWEVNIPSNRVCSGVAYNLEEAKTLCMAVIAVCVERQRRLDEEASAHDGE